jgi:hypothetical protein
MGADTRLSSACSSLLPSHLEDYVTPGRYVSWTRPFLSRKKLNRSILLLSSSLRKPTSHLHREAFPAPLAERRPSRPPFGRRRDPGQLLLLPLNRRRMALAGGSASCG